MSSDKRDPNRRRLFKRRPEQDRVVVPEESEQHRMKEFIDRVRQTMKQQRERIAKDKKKKNG